MHPCSMPYKNPNDPRAKAARRKHYRKNKKAYLGRSRGQKEELKKLVWDLKENTPCADCGEKHPHFVMHFDHLDGGTKTANVAQLVANGQKVAVLKEIEKCEVVCANCHAYRTNNRSCSG